MLIVAIAWIYVVGLMALTEASFVAGIMTFFIYCVLPLSILFYLTGSKRRRAKRARLASAATSTHTDAGLPPIMPSAYDTGKDDNALTARTAPDDPACASPFDSAPVTCPATDHVSQAPVDCAAPPANYSPAPADSGPAPTDNGA